MAVSFNNLVNDSGNNTDGTLMDKAELQLLLMGAVVTSTSTGAQNNWAPGLDGHTLVGWAGAADGAFTGLATGTAGQIAMIRNTGTKVGTFAHLSGSSSAANQFTNCATSGPTPVAPGGWIIYRHDGTNWKLVGHEQGAWITPTYAAGTFTGFGAMTWTVDAGDVTLLRYRLAGRQVTLAFSLVTTSVGGTPNVVLQIAPAGFGGFAPGPTNAFGVYYKSDNAGAQLIAEVGPTATQLQFFNGPAVGAVNWTASANLTAIRGTIAFEVT
jgi:hypothetical protein